MARAAQDAPTEPAAKTVTADDFEGSLADWMLLKVEEGKGFGADGESKLAITTESGQAKAGKGALRYSYEIAPGTARLLALPRALDLSGMKSVHLWVKTSVATALVFGLNEAADISYQAVFTCPANTWQEVAFNLDELAPDTPGKDANGKLDLDQVQAIHVADIGNLLVNVVPTLKGARTIVMDDITFSARAAARTTGAVGAESATPTYRVDNFESPLIRWIPLSLEFSEPPRVGVFDAPLSVDALGEGKGGALKFAYARKAKKAQGLLRSVDKVDLKRATGLSLRLKSERDGLFIVTVGEKDGSRYQQIVPLKAVDGWTNLAYALSTFTLADDSTDENDTCDAAQIKEIGVTDISALLPEGGVPDEAANTLWLDDVQFSLSGETPK